MSVGLPVIVTDKTGMKDLIVSGYNGLVVPARDVGALSTALRSLRQDAGLRQFLGRNARKTALQYDFRRQVDAYQHAMIRRGLWAGANDS
jgi:glycosyltransferase involved in cell wall biosynthesis